MEWNDKVQLVRLGNNQHRSDSEKKEFEKFVFKKVSSFDTSAWDMFITIIDLDIDEMKGLRNLYYEVYQALKKFNYETNTELSIKASLRLALFETICEKELKFKNKNND